MENRKVFIYRMFAMVSEIQDKPNLTTKDITSMLEVQLKLRERNLVEEVGEIAETKYRLAGLHKHSLTNIKQLFKLILTKF